MQTAWMSTSALTATTRYKKGSPDKVIAAVAEAFHDVGLIVLGTDHDDWYHSVRHRLAQLRAELVPCMHMTCFPYMSIFVTQTLIHALYA